MRSAGLYYKNNESKLGRNLLHGANRNMETEPVDYAIQCRTIIVKIALLMIKDNIKLNVSNYRNYLSKKIKPTDPAPGEAPNLYGWLVELCGARFENKQIIYYINKVVNIVLDQMKDRESTVSYPNEYAEYMIEIGQQIWNVLDERC